MKLTDFATLPLAQAYELIVDTKQVGSGQARGFLVNNNDLWKTLKVIQADIAHPLYSLSDTIITTASDAQSYFGMDATKADGVANRTALAVLVSSGIFTQIEADGFIDKTLTKSFPFANTTQLEFDKAKADLLLYVDTEMFKVHYGVVDSANTNHVKSANEKIRITVNVDVVNPVDVTIPVFALTDDFGTHTFAKLSKPLGNVVIKAGSLTGALTLEGKANSLSRWTQFSGTANVSGTYEMLVVSA